MKAVPLLRSRIAPLRARLHALRLPDGSAPLRLHPPQRRRSRAGSPSSGFQLSAVDVLRNSAQMSASKRSVNRTSTFLALRFESGPQLPWTTGKIFGVATSTDFEHMVTVAALWLTFQPASAKAPASIAAELSSSGTGDKVTRCVCALRPSAIARIFAGPFRPQTGAST